MAIQLTLLLISCSLYSMYSSSSFSSSSSSLALLVLVISTFLSLLLSNLRKQLIRASSHKAKPLTSMEEAVHQEKNTLPQDEVAGDVSEDSTASMSESSDSPVSKECTDEDDDDDESLIEISLVDGHYVRQQEKCTWKEQGHLLAEFLPDLVINKRDFMDILSEISEEDNMIEIDIARGSIKCSNFGIKA